MIARHHAEQPFFDEPELRRISKRRDDFIQRGAARLDVSARPSRRRFLRQL
jgi:hypothetical protein